VLEQTKLINTSVVLQCMKETKPLTLVLNYLCPSVGKMLINWLSYALVIIKLTDIAASLQEVRSLKETQHLQSFKHRARCNISKSPSSRHNADPISDNTSNQINTHLSARGYSSLKADIPSTR